MRTVNSNRSLDDLLELDKIAVGPYCVFDSFHPTSTQPRSSGASPPPFAVAAAPMSSEYPFNGGFHGAWMSSGAEQPAAHAAHEVLPHDRWHEWMRWNPSVTTKPPETLNVSAGNGLSPEMESMMAHRQFSQPDLSNESQAIAASGLPIQPFSDTAFTFGQQTENGPAFSFDNAALGSLPTGCGPPSEPVGGRTIWSPGEQPKQVRSGTVSPTSYEPPVEPSGHAIAASNAQSTPSLRHSQSTTPRAASDTSHSSPEPAPSNKKKRKSSTEDEIAETGDLRQPQVKKTAHNMIEKRYRTNLNEKIAALRDSVPSLRVMSRPNGTLEDDDPEDLEGLTPAHKLNKATVLSKATEYIQHLEKRNKRLVEDMNSLKARLDSFDSMPLPPTMALGNHVPTPDSLRFQDDPFSGTQMPGHAVTQAGAQGMIPVPENMMNLRAVRTQQHFAPERDGYPVYSSAHTHPQHGQPTMVARGGSLINKLMVGSLAGLMIVEGLGEREQSQQDTSGRGLFALPAHLLGGINMSATRTVYGFDLHVFPLLKIFLVLGAIVYLIFPTSDRRSKSTRKPASAVRLSPAPSPASPVEVRRKAWLTAIQTVWVPRHSFVLEAAALGLKTLKLSARKLIGWEGYSILTGTTKEHEAARVKAWEIALGAQLTGGDAEISMSRLVLTLMASGTLPDSPARLMLKALHIRVLLWEVAKAGYGRWYMFEELCAKIARIYWNAARKEQKMIANKTSKSSTDADPLPDHLAALIELDCDQVLVDGIVQRAYNLAWNKPSAENAGVDEPMDSVVEDFAISSPLDALAAWWSCYISSRALVQHLGSPGSQPEDETRKHLKLAIRTAPPASGAHMRALVVETIVSERHRERHIATACDALPREILPSFPTSGLASPRSLLMNAVGDGPVAADVRTALTLAKCLSLAAMSDDDARARAAAVVNSYHLAASGFTLLSSAGAFEVLAVFTRDEALLAATKGGLERLASALRVWVGREGGRRSGLHGRTRGALVERCLGFSKMLVGMRDPVEQEDEDDAGYVSQSERGSEGAPDEEAHVIAG